GPTDAKASVATLLRSPGRDVSGGQVAEARITAFQEVVPFLLGNRARRPLLAALLRNPDTSVVPKALAHQCEFGLMGSGNRDAGRVDLGEAGIGEVGALLVRAPSGRHIAGFGVRGKIEDVAIPARAEEDRIACVSLVCAG